MGIYTLDLIIGGVTFADEAFNGKDLPGWDDSRSFNEVKTRPGSVGVAGQVFRLWEKRKTSNYSISFTLEYITIADADSLEALADANPPLTSANYMGRNISVHLKINSVKPHPKYCSTHRVVSGIVRGVD